MMRIDVDLCVDGKIVDDGFTPRTCSCPGGASCAFCDVQSYRDDSYPMRLLAGYRTMPASLSGSRFASIQFTGTTLSRYRLVLRS